MPIKEGDEFLGVDQGSAMRLIINDWVSLYGELAIIFMIIVTLPILLIIPSVLYWPWKSSENLIPRLEEKNSSGNK